MFFNRMMTRSFNATKGVKRPPLTLLPVKITPSDPSLSPELRAKEFINSNLNFLISGIKTLVPEGERSLHLNSPYGVKHPEFPHQTYLGRFCCNVASFSLAATLMLESPCWDIRVIIRIVFINSLEVHHVHIQLPESTGIFSSDPIIVDPTWRGLLVADPPRSFFRDITPAWKQIEFAVNSQLFKPPYDMPIFVGRKSELIQLVNNYINGVNTAHPKLQFMLADKPERLWDGSEYTNSVRQYVERLRKEPLPPSERIYHLLAGTPESLLLTFNEHLRSAALIPELPAPSSTILGMRSLLFR